MRVEVLAGRGRTSVLAVSAVLATGGLDAVSEAVSGLAAPCRSSRWCRWNTEGGPVELLRTLGGRCGSAGCGAAAPWPERGWPAGAVVVESAGVGRRWGGRRGWLRKGAGCLRVRTCGRASRARPAGWARSEVGSRTHHVSPRGRAGLQNGRGPHALLDVVCRHFVVHCEGLALDLPVERTRKGRVDVVSH